MSKPQRWSWAVEINLEELDETHLHRAYRLEWGNLCKFDSCRKNCKRILCLACFDRSWVENDTANNSSNDNFDISNFEQKRTDSKTFVGLKNLGATCYVNCLLQLWFHHPALRKAIYLWERSGNNEQQQDASRNIGQRMILDNTTPTKSNDKDSSGSKTLAITDKDDEDELLPQKSVVSASANANKSSSSKNDGGESNSNDRQVGVYKAPSEQVITINDDKSKDSVQANPIEQLQLIFARMQFTNKKSIDPFNFIDSLALNAAEQQDAQEFGNLFMEFLERSFANQKNQFVSKIIQSQFCGRYSYATICDHCKHSSLSDSNFYELDLSIQNLETLHDCLNEFFRPVPLDGKYNCSHCHKAQSAHRKIILKSLPPTLNLQLLRFIYDVQRNTRQKLNSYILFPEILDMTSYLKTTAETKYRPNSIDLAMRNNNNNNNNDNNYLSFNGTSSRLPQVNKSNIYILSAVLIHRGSSPHSGHYIAHIKDRVTKDWYKFNDDSVERIGPQLQVSTDGENITIVEDKTEIIKTLDPGTGKVIKKESKSLKSKTAYMLVYQAQDNEALTYPSDHSEKWQLPEHLQTAVAEENSRSEELFESLQVAKEEDQRMIDVRKDQIKTIYEKLVCRDSNDKFEFIDKNWLQQWLTNSSTSAKFPPIDNSNLLCIHDKLDFRKLDQVKCVRSEGVDMLYKEFGGGPRLQDAMCRACVELEVRLIQFKERMKEDQKFITSQAKFKLDANYDFADAYIVGKNSYRDWQALVMCKFEKAYPELLKLRRESKQNSNQHGSSDEDENNKIDKGQEPCKDQSNSDSDDEAIEKFVFNSDILCEHNSLIHEPTAWRIVPKEVWAIFKRYFDNDPERPLIELNANTLMCAECKRQEAEQQEIGDVQKAIASEQKSKLPDLFHNRKRPSWCSMQPGDAFYALDRQFLTKWQKFLRNPCNQDSPTAVKNQEKLICEHGKSLYNYSNSNPVLPDCPFVLITGEELNNLRQYYSVDHEVMFYIDQELFEKKLKLYVANANLTGGKTSASTLSLLSSAAQLGESGDKTSTTPTNQSFDSQSNQATRVDQIAEVDLDLTELDWSECVVSKPDYCSDCHEMLKLDELKKLLNYESATIYITRVEGPGVHGLINNPSTSSTQTNGGGGSSTPTTNSINNCDLETNNQTSTSTSKSTDQTHLTSDSNGHGHSDVVVIDEQNPFKRRKKTLVEDEANDFVPPGAVKQQPTPVTAPSSSMLRRTTRRNRNREQAYTIKPTQTLLQLKKEIFQRCQVLPSDQRLFLNDILLDDNSKTMIELRIVPNCSLKLEVDRPLSDNMDLIEDEPTSRKSCAQPETGFKGSLLLSNSHF